ncbi:glycosyltransferase, partial [Thermodesulfobacteriota bacterium]
MGAPSRSLDEYFRKAIQWLVSWCQVGQDARCLAGRALGIPVVFDMHENYPGMVELGYRSGTSPRRDNNPYLFGRLNRYELDACRDVDFIVTVVEESRARLISLGIPPEKIIVVENTMDRGLFEDAVIHESIIVPFRDRFVITYLGGISELRGVGMVIEALPEIARSIPNILFLVDAGSFSSRVGIFTP